MKTSVRQKAAYETISQAITSAYKMTLRSRNSVDKTVKWFIQTKGFLKKMREAASQLTTENKTMHPMLNTAAIPTMREFEKAVGPVMKSISGPLISTSEACIQQWDVDINQVYQQLKQLLTQMCSLYDEFFTDTKSPISQTIAECTESGYDVHCSYLRYANGLDELESQVKEQFELLRGIDHVIVSFENSLWNKLNAKFKENVPQAIQAPESNSQYHDEDFAKLVELFTVGLQGFRMPTAHFLPAYVFTPSTIRMKAKKAFDGKKVGEIALEAGELVDVIDPSLAEWYKVRAANGMEGYVPVNTLLPVQEK